MYYPIFPINKSSGVSYTWLPGKFVFVSKLMLTFQAYHVVAPAYLYKLIKNHHALYFLRSNNMMLLDEPRIKSKPYDQRSFLH